MKWLIFLMMLQLTGCATLSSDATKTDRANSKVYDLNAQAVKSKLLAILQDSKMPVQEVDKANGKIVSRRVKLEVNELKRIGSMPTRDYGGGFKQPWLWARYREQYQLQSVGTNQTKVSVKIRLEGYNASGARWIVISSNGIKEKEILDALQTRLIN